MDTKPLIPPGLTISQWNPARLDLAEQVRTFCLSMVKLTYGYDYKQEWHRDLDSLLEGENSDYAPAQRGTLLLVQTEAGEIVGTAAMRGLHHKPNMVEQFTARYGTAADIKANIASNWRMYIHPAHRKQGLGKVLVSLREMAARNYGYKTMYLHCDINAHRLRAHWESLGFTNFENDSETAHYDKAL